MSKKIGLQRLHHLCLKIKHGFNSRYPRIFVADNHLNRSVCGILMKEGFLSNIQYGDQRGPFIDIINAASSATSSIASNGALNKADLILSEAQRERFEVLRRLREKVASLHRLFGSDGRAALDFVSRSSEHVALSDQQQSITERYLSILSSSSSSSNTDTTAESVQLDKSSNSLLFNEPEVMRFSDAAILSQIEVLPSIDSVKLPSLNNLNADTLLQLTWHKDRKLWLDLRYSPSSNEPALSDMFLISKGSRRVHTDLDELKSILSGMKFNVWRASEVGSVVLLHLAESGEIVTAREALRRGVGGEVLCVAK